jgi:ferredoxin
MAIGGARPTIALLLGCLLEPLNGARHPGYPPSADLLFWLLAMRLFCLQVAAHHWIICPRSSTACPSTTTPAALATRHRPGLCIDHCHDVFVMLEDGIAYVAEDGRSMNDPGGSGSLATVDPRHQQSVIDAALACPGECIFIEVGRIGV